MYHTAFELEDFQFKLCVFKWRNFSKIKRVFQVESFEELFVILLWILSVWIYGRKTRKNLNLFKNSFSNRLGPLSQSSNKLFEFIHPSEKKIKKNQFYKQQFNLNWFMQTNEAFCCFCRLFFLLFCFFNFIRKCALNKSKITCLLFYMKFNFVVFFNCWTRKIETSNSIVSIRNNKSIKEQRERERKR